MFYSPFLYPFYPSSAFFLSNFSVLYLSLLYFLPFFSFSLYIMFFSSSLACYLLYILSNLCTLYHSLFYISSLPSSSSLFSPTFALILVQLFIFPLSLSLHLLIFSPSSFLLIFSLKISPQQLSCNLTSEKCKFKSKNKIKTRVVYERWRLQAVAVCSLTVVFSALNLNLNLKPRVKCRRGLRTALLHSQTSDGRGF